MRMPYKSLVKLLNFWIKRFDNSSVFEQYDTLNKLGCII